MEQGEYDVDVNSLLLTSSNEEDNASDSDEDLIQIENITDLDSSVEIVETITKDEKFYPVEHMGKTPSDDASAACRSEVNEDQVHGERWDVKKCSVLVRNLRLGQIRERAGDDSEYVLMKNINANTSKTGTSFTLSVVESDNSKKRTKRSQMVSSLPLPSRFSKRIKKAGFCQKPEARLSHIAGDCRPSSEKSSEDKLLGGSVKKQSVTEKFDQQLEQMIEKVPTQWHCKQCGKTSNKKQHIVNHVETHIQDIHHSCRVCSRLFKTLNSLRAHMSTFHSKFEELSVSPTA